MAMYTLMEFNGDHLSDLYGKGDVLVPVLAAVIANPSNAYLLEEYGLHRAIRVVKQSGNQYDDTRVNVGNLPEKKVPGVVQQFVLDAVNHESMHMQIQMRNLEERLNERITEAEVEVMARVVKVEDGDTPIQLSHTEKIDDAQERLVKLEERLTKRENHANVTSQNIIKLIHMLADSGNTEAQQMLGMVEGK